MVIPFVVVAKAFAASDGSGLDGWRRPAGCPAAAGPSVDPVSAGVRSMRWVARLCQTGLPAISRGVSVTAFALVGGELAFTVAESCFLVASTAAHPRGHLG